MKKIIYTFLLFLLFMGTTNAQGCNLVSGTGKNIGDEIVCGTEHFYVWENNGKQIKMLSKYNLYVGFNLELKELGKKFDTEEEANSYATELYSNDYEDLLYIIQDEDGKYSSVVLFKLLDNTEVRQNSEAIGAHGDERGNPDPTQKGLISLREGGYSVEDGYSEAYGGGYYYDYTYLKDGLIEPHLTKYYEYLNTEYEIQEVDMLSIKDINAFVKTVANKELPLEEWGADLHSRDFDLDAIYILGNLKEYVPEQYDWLWSTTYWTKTISEPYEWNAFIYFIDTLGDVCAVGSCQEVAGAGLRPIVTMSADNIAYKIKIKTDGNGKVESSKEQAKALEEIEFKVIPNEEYVLQEVKVTDSNGNIVIFTDYSFTMPTSDVLIEATFVPVNPDTSDIFIIASITIVIGTLISYLNIKKMKELS